MLQKHITRILSFIFLLGCEIFKIVKHLSQALNQQSKYRSTNFDFRVLILSVSALFQLVEKNVKLEFDTFVTNSAI